MLMVQTVDCSRDSKTGPIPVTYQTEGETCPTSCPLKGKGCYARFHNVGRVWRNLHKAADAGEEKGNYRSWERFLKWVAAMIDGQPWRYGVAGDLPHTGDGKTIDAPKVRALIKANAIGNKRGWLYTHHEPSVPGNAEIIKEANTGGLTVNLSADGLAEADELFDLGIAPVVTLMPKTEFGKCKTPKGRKVVECLASNERSPVKNCIGCKFLCQKADRDFIIGFPPHGGATKMTAKTLTDNS